MKPSRFAYHAPTDLDEALAVLAEVGDEGKVLAGGQSLVPMLSMRLAAPAHLVDINRIPGLDTVQTTSDGVRVGALARHADVERDEAAAARLPVLRQGLRLVAHPTIRNRGTTVGSLVHADPSGEMPALLALLGGSVELRRSGGSRVVDAEAFFVGALESCIQPGELAVAAYFPAPVGRTGSAFVELARRRGDYAMCGVCVVVTLDDTLDGCRRARRRATSVRSRTSAGPRPERGSLWTAGRHSGLGGCRRAGDDAGRDRGRHPRDRGLPPAPGERADCPRGRRVGGRRRSPVGRGVTRHEPEERLAVDLTVNGVLRSAMVPARRLLSDFLRHDLRLHRHPCRLRARRVRRLHGPRRRPARAVLPDVRGVGGRARRDDGGGARGPRRLARPGAAGLPRVPRPAVRLLHARLPHHDHGLYRRAPRPEPRGRSRGDRRQPVPLHRLPEHRASVLRAAEISRSATPGEGVAGGAG